MDREGLEKEVRILLLVGVILVLLCQCCRSAATPKSGVRGRVIGIKMPTGAPLDAGTKLVVPCEVEEAEHVVDDEYFVLTPDNDRYNESLDEYSFYDGLNGRERYPDAVQAEVDVFVEPITDDEMRRMVVRARLHPIQARCQA